MDDARPFVRHRACITLGNRGRQAVCRFKNIQKSLDHFTRNAVWTAMRLGNCSELANLALKHADPTVQQTAAHYAGIHRLKSAVPGLLKLLQSPSHPVRREAATALGCIGDAAAVPALLAAAHADNGRVLEHSLIYALIEIGDAKATRRFDSKNAHTQRAALIALDQMPGAKITAMQLLPRLTAEEPVLRETALWLFGRHPEMAKEMGGYLRKQLARAAALGDDERADLQQQLAAFAHDPTIREVMTAALAKEARATRWLVFDGMAGAR